MTSPAKQPNLRHAVGRGIFAGNVARAIQRHLGLSAGVTRDFNPVRSPEAHRAALHGMMSPAGPNPLDGG